MIQRFFVALPIIRLLTFNHAIAFSCRFLFLLLLLFPPLYYIWSVLAAACSMHAFYKIRSAWQMQGGFFGFSHKQAT